MSGYKINKDLHKAGYINCYLHRLFVYHVYKPIDNSKDQIVTGALLIGRIGNLVWVVTGAIPILRYKQLRHVIHW